MQKFSFISINDFHQCMRCITILYCYIILLKLYKSILFYYMKQYDFVAFLGYSINNRNIISENHIIFIIKIHRIEKIYKYVLVLFSANSFLDIIIRIVRTRVQVRLITNQTKDGDHTNRRGHLHIC